MGSGTLTKEDPLAARVSRFDLLLDRFSDLKDEMDGVRTDLSGIVTRLDTRVDELERFHIAETASARERVAIRTAELARWQKLAIWVGSASGIVGAAGGIFSLGHAAGWW